MPSVATSGVIPSWVTARPLIVPEATQASTTSPIAAGSLLSAPFGYFVTMIVVSVIIPGTDRSRPRCWITSVWPIAAIARIAANGSIERSAVLLTLPVASSGLTAKRSAVASQIERNGGSVRPRMRAITRAGRRAGRVPEAPAPSAPPRRSPRRARARRASMRPRLLTRPFLPGARPRSLRR